MKVILFLISVIFLSLQMSCEWKSKNSTNYSSTSTSSATTSSVSPIFPVPTEEEVLDLLTRMEEKNFVRGLSGAAILGKNKGDKYYFIPVCFALFSPQEKLSRGAAQEIENIVGDLKLEVGNLCIQIRELYFQLGELGNYLLVDSTKLKILLQAAPESYNPYVHYLYAIFINHSDSSVRELILNKISKIQLTTSDVLLLRMLESEPVVDLQEKIREVIKMIFKNPTNIGLRAKNFIQLSKKVSYELKEDIFLQIFFDLLAIIKKGAFASQDLKKVQGSVELMIDLSELISSMDLKMELRNYALRSLYTGQYLNKELFLSISKENKEIILTYLDFIRSILSIPISNIKGMKKFEKVSKEEMENVIFIFAGDTDMLGQAAGALTYFIKDIPIPEVNARASEILEELKENVKKNGSEELVIQNF